MRWKLYNWLLKKADRYFGERIIYGHLSSMGIDNLCKMAEANRATYGHTNYRYLALHLKSYPL